jgi:hypothetical protein
MNIKIKKIIDDVKPDLINFIDYLCIKNKLDCSGNNLLFLIQDYITYKTQIEAQKAEEKAQIEAQKEAKKEEERRNMDFSHVIKLGEEYDKMNANRTRQDPSPIYYERTLMTEEDIERNLKKASEIDKGNNIKFLKKEKEIVKNNLDAVISSLQFKIKNTDLKIELQNNIYKLIHSGVVRNNDKIEDFNSDLLKISNFLYVDKTTSEDFDYTNHMLELSKINLLIGDLDKKFTIINEQTGGKATKYKSTGITVFILYKKKKYNRTIYVKDKGNTKYCKINNEYILLSKLKVIL